jgi:hypothetical protein
MIEIKKDVLAMKRLMCLMLSCFCVLSLCAQDVPTRLSKVYVKNYRAFNYVTVFDSTKVDMMDSGLSYVRSHVLHKILNKKGALSLKNIILDYDPLSASVEFTKLTLWKKSGKSINIDISKVLDYPAPAHMIYWGARQKMLEINGLSPGDALEIEYKRKGYTYALLKQDDSNYIPPMRGHFYDIVPFYSNIPIIQKYYSLSTPSSKNLKYKIFNSNSIHASEKSVGEKNVYSFVMKNIMPIKRESAMLDLSDIAPKVVMTTAKDWKQKASWFNKVNEDYERFKSFPRLDKFVSKLVKDAKTEYDSIANLTHWVADNMRYCGVTMGKGEGFTLHNAKMNFHDRAGVCKDKAGLLITMLRSAGFESYPAMTMAGSRIEDIPADQFNHCVALVKMKSGYYKILDPTWVPFVRELWSSAEQQQNYLPGIPGGADLQITPISSAENHYIKVDVNSKVDNKGNLVANIKLVAEGQSDSSFRSRFTHSKKSSWDDIAKSLLVRADIKMIIDRIKYSNPYDYSKPFELSAQVRIPSYLRVADNKIFYKSLASHLFTNKYSHLRIDTKSKFRKYDFRDRCSRQVKINERVEFFKDIEVEFAPDSKDISSDISTFVGAYASQGNVLNLNIDLKLGKRIYKKLDWNDFRKSVVAHKNYINTPVILKLN